MIHGLDYLLEASPLSLASDREATACFDKTHLLPKEMKYIS